MDLVLVLLAASVVAVLAALFFVSKFQKKEKEEGIENVEVEEPEEETGNRRPRRSVRERMLAGRAVRAQQNLNRRVAPVGEEPFDPDMQDDVETLLEQELSRLPDDKKLTAKVARRLELKAEKKAEAEMAKQQRAQKQEREETRLANIRKKEEEEELENQKKAEEEAKRKEEQEKREQAEFEEWKKTFAVEESGEDAVDEDESQSLLREFMDFIKEKKVVLLEDLAARFNLKTQDAISRLKDLLAAGEIEGLMDDRGKFIHITQEEYASVAKFITQNGRISIAELAQSSTELLHL